MTLLQRDREKYEEGLAEGKLAELISLAKEGILPINIAASRLNKTPEEFAKLMQQVNK